MLQLHQTRHGISVYLDGHLMPSVCELHPNCEEGYIDLRVPLAGITLNGEEVLLRENN